MRKILSALLAFNLLCSLNISVFAAEEGSNQVISKDTGITQGISEITLDIIKSEDILIATVPIELPIVVDTRGNITVPTDAVIVNETDNLTIMLTEVFIDVDSDETGVDIIGLSEAEFYEHMAKYGGKQIWLEMFGYSGWENHDPDTGVEGPNYIDEITGAGYLYINPGESLPLNLRVLVNDEVWSELEAYKQVLGTITFTLTVVE